MTTKKDPARFTLRFNLQDPHQRKAVSYLDRQAQRTRSQYIAQAILVYEGQQSAYPAGEDLRREVESIVQEILRRTPAPQPPPPAEPPPEAQPTDDLIFETLALFQKQ